jgi:hypothetical protein
MANRITLENVEDAFTYHAPSPGQAARYAKIKEAAVAFAKVVLQECQPSADTTRAIQTIRQARMEANQAIATEHLNELPMREGREGLSREART